tara:strand:+ start:47 stop:148 length:102 start_codon:yes stop_codon:yes gene_type:complete
VADQVVVLMLEVVAELEAIVLLVMDRLLFKDPH